MFKDKTRHYSRELYCFSFIVENRLRAKYFIFNWFQNKEETRTVEIISDRFIFFSAKDVELKGILRNFAE